MSYFRSVPKELIDALTWLGKKKWQVARSSFGVQEVQARALLNEASRYGNRFVGEVASVLLSCSRFRPNGLVPENVATVRSQHLFIASQVLATGQKTLLLSQELCESFENTEVGVTFREYRQPFDTMVIELPANYAEGKVIEGVADYPLYVALHHIQQERLLLVDLGFRNTTTLINSLMYQPDDIIEELVQKVVTTQDHAIVDDAAKIQRVMPLFRIAFNAMLAMTYGIDGNKCAPLPPQQQTKKSLRKRTECKDKVVAHRARLHLAALPTFFRFDQTIKAFDVQQSPAKSPSSTTGSPKKPHWRRGHWRQQRVGQGRVEHELRWIRPKLIRADRFGGDLKDTTTTYTT